MGYGLSANPVLQGEPDYKCPSRGIPGRPPPYCGIIYPTNKDSDACVLHGVLKIDLLPTFVAQDITVYSHELKNKNLNYITREPDEERERRNSGTKLYRNQRPGGCPFDLHLPLVASLRKFRSLLYETAESKICCHRKPFFDKAAMETPSDSIKGSINAWRLCTVTQVEELKSIIRLLPIWASGIVFSAVYSQMGTLFVLQGNTMGTSFEIPIYDHLTVPFARKFTGHKTGFTQLQCIVIGLMTSIFDPDAMRSLCSALSLTAAAALGNSDLLN
ncbi:hypothetical protein ACOSP7_029331 [Xanthoceras sorbifolium]